MNNNTRKINLAFITTSLTRGGAEIMLYKILSYIDIDNFEIHVIVLDGAPGMSESFEKLNISLYKINMKNSPLSAWRLLKLIFLLNKIKPDIIQGWMYHGNIAATLTNCFLFFRCSVVWGIRQSLYDISRESYFTQWVIRLSRCFAKKTNGIIYNSAVSMGHHRAVGFSNINTINIPNGFDTKLFRTNPVWRKSVRQTLRIANDYIVIGMVARYHPVKNHALFFAAANQLIKQEKKVCFLLAGPEITLNTPQIAEQLNLFPALQKHLLLLGEREDIPAILNAMDIFSLTSHAEAFPNAVGEAMACGVPCVATDVGDIAKLTGDCGRVIKEPSAEQLSAVWLEWIRAGVNYRTALGAKARRRICDHYTIQKVTEQYQNIYQELASKCAD